MTLKNRLGWLVLLAGLAGGRASRSEGEIPCEGTRVCPDPPRSPLSFYCETSRLWFEADDVSGALGDVVAVTISLHFAPDLDVEHNSISLAVCHDPSMAELVGEPIYAEDVLARNPILVEFIRVAEDQNAGHTGFGFSARFAAMQDRSPVAGELPLLTVYYRLIRGTPGATTEISFCDGPSLQFGLRDCNFNGIINTRIREQRWPLLSSRNRNAVLTVRDGPVTQPEPPPPPPDAVVYPEPPASDEVNLRVRIGSTFARPGERAVPIDVFVTADVEYTGIIIPIDFDERYVRVAHIEKNFLAGRAEFDNEDALPGAQAAEGYAVLATSMIGNRRVAPAGEEFQAATMYIDVLESADSVAETRLEPRPVGGRIGDPFVIVRYLEGSAAEEVEVRGEFGAIEITSGSLAIRPAAETSAGDANFDGVFDISDPVSVLGYLFLGDTELLCPGAADYDGDGRLLISDPIGMLGALFGRGPSRDGLVQCR